MGEGRFIAAMLLFTDVTTGVDDPYLARALRLAERGRGATAPNPCVGCVVVAGGRIVGEGYHPRAGQAHAEVFALADAGVLARGADVYVTLEPCAHHGRTPPCTDALISSGVASVTIGMRDPSAEARGGVEALASAGIAVHVSEAPEPFMRANTGWLKRIAVGLPWVTVKVGASIDGRPAITYGERASMTGPSGAQVTRLMRSRCDAVVVGASTVVADDPELTVRDESGRRAEHNPLRVVLARSVAPPLDARVFVDAHAPTMLLAPQRLLDGVGGHLPRGVTTMAYDEDEGVAGALRALGSHGVNDVLVEAGPRLLDAIVSADVADEIVVVTGGGFAGDSAPAMLVGDACAGQTELSRPFAACESAVVGDIAVTKWIRCSPECGSA
ncbi:MAG: bifunctional diaminohydroxyphosphoribosylaminopyrimidine deaminase/5-amino-6-(5-phosphoribosylamino)uracil reductase RibD [Coriobacteriia bacterium]|nr:bifunctional diaminohydroxyphosphoribosylaminopyrimidine deaminase/5-amino-6-(5-phosphoribosylamino)uracil reductase RibD [Coriobacteriia bacterium]